MGNRHLSVAGKKFQKCLVCFAPSPEEKVIFPFSVPIIFLEPSLYGAHKHHSAAANHHSMEKSHQNRPANDAEKWVPRTPELTNFMTVFVAPDVSGPMVAQPAV